MQIRRTAAALTSAAALSITGVAMATPAQAAPLFVGGLINVNVSDIELANDSLNENDVRILNNLLRDSNVGIGAVAQVAATVCDVNVGGILGQLADTERATCEATNDAGTIVFTQTT